MFESPQQKEISYRWLLYKGPKSLGAQTIFLINRHTSIGRSLHLGCSCCRFESGCLYKELRLIIMKLSKDLLSNVSHNDYIKIVDMLFQL